MVCFQDSIQDITGVGRRTERHFDRRHDVTTVGELVAELGWRSLRSRLQSTYYEEAKADVLRASLESSPSVFSTPAEARAAQWGFLIDAPRQSSVTNPTWRKGHAVVGDWQNDDELPSPRDLSHSVEAILPTHRTVDLSDAAYKKRPRDGIVPAHFVSSESLGNVTTVTDTLLDGGYDPADTLLPARTIGTLATLLDTTPTTLLDDAQFAPHGPAALSDPHTGLDVLVGPLRRPDVKQVDKDAGVDRKMVTGMGLSL